MAENSKIAWCDHTINFWWGCEKVHECCASCYAEAWSKRYGLKLWGPGSVRKRIKGAIPLAKKLGDKARDSGIRQTVFSNSMSDFFEAHQGPITNEKGCRLLICDNCGAMHIDDDSPEPCPHKCGRPKERMDYLTIDDLRREAFACIDSTPWLDWLLLTKRPENVSAMTPDYSYHACVSGDCPHWSRSECDKNTKFRDNVWLGTSISLQEHADDQIPDLLKCRELAQVLFLSLEPLLDRLELWRWLTPKVCGCTGDRDCECFPGESLIDWIIAGGESGPKARACDVNWIRDLVNQCDCGDVPLFVKQLGARPFDPQAADNVKGARRKFSREELKNPISRAAAATVLERVVDAMVIPLTDKKGGDWTEWPEDLRIREFPEVTHA